MMTLNQHHPIPSRWPEPAVHPEMHPERRRSRAVCIGVVIAALLGSPHRSASAGESTSIAVAAHVKDGVPRDAQDLASTFLELLEVQLASDPQLAVVERMRLDAVLRELVLNQSLQTDAEQRLQLGRLRHADLILLAEIPIPATAPPTTAGAASAPHMLIRLVESLTGVVRGATVAPLTSETLDESVEQIARYVGAVLQEPQQAGVTVAVGAFESRGRFDRLRPLELGVRDLITARLLHLGRFRILQRDSLQHLNDELDLIRSSLKDASHVPETLPQRRAAYFLSGTIDEADADGSSRQEATDFAVAVEGRLVQASNGRVLAQLQLTSAAAALPETLAARVDELVRDALPSILERTSAADETRLTTGTGETRRLRRLALRDVERFRRRCPIDFSEHRFRLPERAPISPAYPEIHHADSPLGRHLLRKAIDRLESLRYIESDDLEAEYALGYCYAFHIPDIGRPKRSGDLLRGVFEQSRQSALGAAALQLLGEVSFHHRTAKLVPGQRTAAIEHAAFAFLHMPAAHRSRNWPRLLELLTQLVRQDGAAPILLDVLREATRLAESPPDGWDWELARTVAPFAAQLSQTGDERVQAEAALRLQRWAGGDDLPVVLVSRARRVLGDVARRERKHALAAQWYAKAASCGLDATDARLQHDARNLLIHAARSFSKADAPDKALELLESLEIPSDDHSLNHGYLLVELGDCYEQLGHAERAHEIYLAAAEQIPGLVDNSNVVSRIKRLGGVPLSETRDVDVRYVAAPNERPFLCRTLASDASHLYCAGRFPGVFQYHVQTGQWSHLTGGRPGPGTVNSLAVDPKAVWAGTSGQGLWQYDLTLRTWTRWGLAEGLPDERMVSLTSDGAGGVYAGVGTRASGGLVHLNPNHPNSDQTLTVFTQPDAPRSAVTHLVNRRQSVLARTEQGISLFRRHRDSWEPLDEARAPYLFAGSVRPWASQPGHELYPFSRTGRVRRRYATCWFPKGLGRSGYRVRWLVEREQRIWFGGSPWQRFQSVGVYAVDRDSGAFTRYGPREGFRLSSTYESYDGLWAADRLWVATSAGLADVTRREPARKDQGDD